MSKPRADKVEVICPYCQNRDPTLIEPIGPELDPRPVWTFRKFACGVCSKVFVIRSEGAAS